MDPKKTLSRELAARAGGHVSSQEVYDMVEQFFRHGNTFLLSELIKLKWEVESLKEELQTQRDSKQKTLQELLIP